MIEAVGREERIARLRARYEALKAAGSSPKTLPGPSPLPAPEIGPEALIWKETVPPGWRWTARLQRGQILRIVNATGRSSAAFAAWNAAEPTERFYHGDTVKVQWTTRMGKGRLLLSQMGRVLASVVEDSTGGAHDMLAGGSTTASNARRYGPGEWRNTRDNMISAIAKLGLGLRDIPPVVSFFAPVSVSEDGRFAWRDDERRAGDYVELRAEMDLLVALSNCPHPFDPAPDYAPGEIELSVKAAAPVAAADLCRTATDEAVRAFQNNDAPLWA